LKILRPLLYFSIFNHPLKKEEIFLYSLHKKMEDVEEELKDALEKKIITQTDDFFHPNLTDENIANRIAGNENAIKALVKAKKKGHFIKKYFPFVEGVSISGSLSKGYFDADSDVDFFIISKPNHLWTCRTFLVIFKKIFLFNSRKYFCLNYFISSDDLEIEEKNIFTATEIATLIPIQGDVFNRFFLNNNWNRNLLPNKTNNSLEKETIEASWIVRLLETILQKRFGALVEKFCFTLTFNVWKIKFRNKMKPEDFAIAFKSSKKVSKHHPSNFQKKVIDLLNNKYLEIKEKHNIDIPKEHV
jgi:predicted nucleotidyltransferase